MPILHRLPFILLLLIPFRDPAAAQQHHRYLSLGSRTTGICFGNSPAYAGIRFNAWDRREHDPCDRVNGINLTGGSFAQEVNGVSIGALAAVHQSVNGICIGLLDGAELSGNGLFAGALVTGNVSGIALSLVTIPQRVNGISLSLFGHFDGAGDQYGDMHGVVLSGFCNRIRDMRGVCAGILYTNIGTAKGLFVAARNHARQLHGVQLGLWNTADNKRHLKSLPLVNLCFRN